MSIPTSRVSVTWITPFLISITICAPLWAVNVLQAKSYFRTYRSDRKLLKYLVGTCVLLNTGQLTALAYTVYFWLITCRIPDNYPLLGSLEMILAPSYLTYILISVVQCFYAMRVWHLSGKRKLLVGIILCLSFMQLSGGLALCTYMRVVDGSITTANSYFNHVSGGIELGSSMLCDLVISASLVHYLRGHHDLQGFRSTRNVVNKLILYSVNIGLVTNVVALLNIVTWLALPDTNYAWSIFHFAIGKIYVNSMLVSLNAREEIRQQLNSGDNSANIFDIDGVRSHPAEITFSRNLQLARASSANNHQTFGDWNAGASLGS